MKVKGRRIDHTRVIVCGLHDQQCMLIMNG